MFSKIKLFQFFKLKNIHQYEIYNFLKKDLTSKLVRVKNSKLYNAIKKFEDFILKNEEVKLKFTILKNEELMVFADSLINFNTSYLINFELETYSINDEAFIPISLILKNFPLIKYLFLNFKSNDLKDKGIETVCSTFKHLGILEKMNISIPYREISLENLQKLSQAISDVTTLTELSLDLSYINLKTKLNGLKKIYEMRLKVIKLYFSSNYLEFNHILDLTQELSKIQSLTSLSIDLSHNNITKHGLSLIINTISSLKYLKSIHLVLRNDFIQIEQESDFTFFSSLSKLKKITYLYLDFLINPQFGSIGVTSLAYCLKDLTSLQSLTIIFSHEIEEDAAMILGYSLGHLTNLKYFKINISGKNLTDLVGLVFYSTVSKLKNYCLEIYFLDSKYWNISKKIIKALEM